MPRGGRSPILDEEGASRDCRCQWSTDRIAGRQWYALHCGGATSSDARRTGCLIDAVAVLRRLPLRALRAKPPWYTEDYGGSWRHTHTAEMQLARADVGGTATLSGGSE